MAEGRKARPWRDHFERRVATLAVAVATPGALLGLWAIWHLRTNTLVRLLVSAVLLLLLVALIHTLLKTIITPLRSLANVLEAYRRGDYTIRGRQGLDGDALGDLVNETVWLGGTLHEQRLKAIEATALLDRLIGAIGVAVLAFDSDRHLRIINPAAAQLLAAPPAFPSDKTAKELGVDALLDEGSHTRLITSVAGRTGRWQVMHGTFRESGRAQHLLIISDVQLALREEERAAWQRLIRVIGHEVNNSLAPIKSMAESLQSLLSDVLAVGKTRDDTLDALRVMGERTAGLSRFLAQYSRLARLPTARPRWQLLASILARVGALEPLRRCRIDVSQTLEACVDADHLEQALINLAKNAVEAEAGREGQVSIEAQPRGMDLIITIKDEGM